MSSTELLDIYTKDREHIGTATRKEVHEKGYWHQAFHCWLYTKEEDGAYLIFQKRHPDKDSSPNMLDITAAGHLTAGERPEEGIREVEEELGIKINLENLTSLSILPFQSDSNGFIDREFCHVFLGECATPLEQFTPQADEVTALFKVRMDQAMELFRGVRKEVTCHGVALDANGDLLPATETFLITDFAHFDNPFSKTVLKMISGHLQPDNPTLFD